VQVLQDQHQRGALSQPGQQLKHPAEQPVAGGLHVGAAVAVQQPPGLVAQRAHERPEGQRGPGQRRGLPGQHPRPGRGRPRLGAQLVDQPGLADAGHPGQQHDLGLACHRPRVGGRHGVPLGGPAHDRGRSGHTGSVPPAGRPVDTIGPSPGT
jgi:hypothetical protein